MEASLILLEPTVHLLSVGFAVDVNIRYSFNKSK